MLMHAHIHTNTEPNSNPNRNLGQRVRDTLQTKYQTKQNPKMNLNCLFLLIMIFTMCQRNKNDFKSLLFMLLPLLLYFSLSVSFCIVLSCVRSLFFVFVFSSFFWLISYFPKDILHFLSNAEVSFTYSNQLNSFADEIKKRTNKIARCVNKFSESSDEMLISLRLLSN